MNKVILDPTHIRQQAIDDELLVDHSALAENAGFLTGVAVTKAVYHGVIGISSKSVGTTISFCFASLFSTNKDCAHRLQAVAADSLLLSHANF